MYQQLLKLIQNSYAPYSKIKVACIVVTNKDNFSGVNVENASYSLTMCAERNAIFTAITNGAKIIKEVHLLSINGNTIPCGACLQVISEFAHKDVPIICYNKQNKQIRYKLSQLLPKSFKIKRSK